MEPNTNQGELLVKEPDIDYQVVKSNELIEAQYALTANQQKLLNAAISRINPMERPEAGKLPVISITAVEISEMTGIPKRAVYAFVKSAVHQYHSSPIYKLKPGGDPKKPNYDVINIAHKSTWENGLFSIQFHSDIINDLIELQEYTRYTLARLKKLNSKYAIRLYELSQRHLKPSTYFEIYKIFSLEELQFFLGVSHTDKNGKVETVASYLDYKNFRKRVLDPAINEVCKNTDVEVSYSVKTSVGRKITHLKFAFKHVAAASKYRGEVSEITRRLSFVEPITMAKTIVEKYSNITIATNLDYLNNIIERDFDVKNLSKFFLYLLKYDIASLPDIANPHSGLHKPQTADYDFIRMHIMPNWLLIPDSWKRDLQIYGLSASCVRDDFHMFKTQWDLGNIPKHVFVSVHQVDSPEWQEEFKSWASSETMLDW